MNDSTLKLDRELFLLQLRAFARSRCTCAASSRGEGASLCSSQFFFGFIYWLFLKVLGALEQYQQKYH
jgi:hypothetical protein